MISWGKELASAVGAACQSLPIAPARKVNHLIALLGDAEPLQGGNSSQPFQSSRHLDIPALGCQPYVYWLYEPSTVGIHHTSPNLGLGMSAPFQLLLVASALALCSLQVLVNLCHVPFSSSFKVLSVLKYLQVFCIRRISLQMGGFSLTPPPPPDKKEANNITRTPRTRWDMDNIKHCTSQHGS